MPKNLIIDPEFGEVKVRRSALATKLKLKIDQSGKLLISLPSFAPLFIAKRFLNDSRGFVRESMAQVRSQRAVLKNGDLIGKSHTLQVKAGSSKSSKIVGTTIIIELPSGAIIESNESQDFIKQEALKALRIQAKAYLSRRLDTIALNNSFYYSKLRFTTAGTRWGSCSSSGTISLNIWLMQLPFDLIDYVLVHELCHTKELNHSADFWNLVESISPNYKQHRKLLKAQQPYL